MKQLIPIFFIFLFVGIFFRQTLFFGKLPVPSDTLVGMYHPWLDFIAKEYPSGMPFKNFLITDPIRQQIPWRKLAVESLKKGTINAWNPYGFSGTPLSTNIQSGFFYPLNTLFLFLPFPVAWTLLIILQQILSGIFFYIFLKVSVKLSNYSSLFGSVCFMFCGFSIVWLTWGTIGQTLLWLPLLLILSDILLTARQTKKRIAVSISLGLVLATQYFAGHSQIFLYSFILFVTYASFRFLAQKSSGISRKGACIGIAGSLGLFILLTSVHWIPFLSELPDMSRLQDGAFVKNEGFFLPFQHLVQFIAPDFFGNPATLNYWGVWNYGEFSGYIGIAGLFFVLYSIFSKKKRQIVFWFFVTIVGLLFALPTPIAKIPYIVRIPIISSLQPTRLLSMVDVGLCVLGAIGFDTWMRYNRKKYVMLAVIIIAMIIGFIWYVVKANPFKIVQENLDVTGRNIIFPTVIFGLTVAVVFGRLIIDTIYSVICHPELRLSGAKDLIVYIRGFFGFQPQNDTPSRNIVNILFAIFLIGISFYDLSRFGWKFTPFTDPALFFPKTEVISFLEKQPKPFRITSIDDRVMPPNVSSYYGIESVAGYDPLYDSRYEKFIAAMERGEPNITPPFGFNRIIAPKNISSPLFQLLGVRFVLSLSDIHDSRFKKVMQEGQTRVYEDLSFLPRTYLLTDIRVINGDENIITALYDPSFRIKSEGIVEQMVEADEEDLLPDEKAGITAYSANAMELSVAAHTKRLLFIGNRYHKGWKAYVDGVLTPIIRVNYLFIGMVVSEGVHNVQLLYE